MRAAIVIAASTAGIGLGAGYLVAGPLGVAVIGTVLAVVVIAGGRAGMVQGVPRRAAVRDKRERSDDGAAAFRAYRKIAADLGWAGVSRRHYDLSVRPLFARLAAAVLAERHRVDMAREPGLARRLVGDDLWPLIDPAQRGMASDHAPGADPGTVARIVARLEEL